MSREPFYLAVWRVNRIVPSALVLLAIANIALFALLVLFYFPRLDREEKDYIRLQAETRHGTKSLSPKQAYAQAKDDLQRFRSALPVTRHFSDLLGDLYGLAADCNLGITQIGFKPKEMPEEDILSYALTFSVTGTYGEIKRFIHGLEASPRIVVIDKISLRADDQGENGNAVGLNIQLTTYFRQEEKK